MADPSSVFVYAVIKPAEGKRDEVGPQLLISLYQELLTSNISQVEAGIKELVSLVEANEPGCLRYNWFFNEDEGTYHVAEQYAILDSILEKSERNH